MYLTFLGWGDGSNSDNLYQVLVEVVRQEECSEFYDPYFDPETMICAGDLENGDRGVCSVSVVFPFYTMLPHNILFPCKNKFCSFIEQTCLYFCYSSVLQKLQGFFTANYAFKKSARQT